MTQTTWWLLLLLRFLIFTSFADMSVGRCGPLLGHQRHDRARLPYTITLVITRTFRVLPNFVPHSHNSPIL
ncbi:hypothetical protein F4823DRAFT_617714 [Ustulina deusta]|nr:hypothetical protein F4823DRAFT_617714 [Ustulina deusta]